jgi:predicted nucleic acid-binding protein
VSTSPPFGGDVLLADTSVWRRADRLPDNVKDEWLRAVAGNQIASSPVVLVELLYRSKDSSEHFTRWRKTFAGLSRYLVPDRHVWDLVLDAYVELQATRQLAGISLTDAIVAATATRHSLPVLHYDRDYERIAALNCMDFVPRRILPPGTDV